MEERVEIDSEYYYKLKDNLETYEIFKQAIEEISIAEEYSKEEILESLKYELKNLEGELE